ncbi:MAG: NAD-dependent epimerase/dehydratase family protein [Patescibacteria group bacterium]
MAKTILVTGAAGFIASNFIQKFKKEFPSTEIVGIDDFSTGRKEALDTSITFYKGSVTDAKLLKKIFQKHAPEYVFHFAARPRVTYSVEHLQETTEVNIGGTAALLEAARDSGIQRFIYSSSSAVPGPTKEMPTSESVQVNPISPYAFQKYSGEVLSRMASELYGFDTVSLRYFNVFGPGQYGDSPYATVVAGWLEAIYFPKKKVGYIEGDGKQAKDMCFVDNVVDANILAMKYPKPLRGGVFNIAHSKPISINEIAKLIEKHTGKKLVLEKRPPRMGDVRFSHADITKAKRVLGFKPETNFETCLKKTIAWFETRKK